MKASIFKTCLLLFFLNITIFSFSLSSAAATIKGVYYPSGQVTKIPPSSLDTTYFTHLYYAFLVPDNNSNYIYNIDSATGKSLLDFTTSLHRKIPPVTALFSIGGGDVDPALFANMASTASTRKAFITNTIQLARKYGFDGMDLDWEAPQNEIEMGYFGSLIDDWRTAIVSESKASNKPQLLLTGALYFANSFFLRSNTRSYPIASINKNMDWINAMAYDLHGSWDAVTGAPAALYDPTSNISTSYGLQSWIKAGIQKNKLVMGMPLYGHTWTLKNPRVSGVGAPAVGIGPSGDAGPGQLAYYEIVKYIADHNAKVVLDLPTVSAYAVDGSVWIGYDSTNSTALKVKYAQNLGIRGYFFWAVGYDLNNQLAKAASDSWTS